MSIGVSHRSANIPPRLQLSSSANSKIRHRYSLKLITLSSAGAERRSSLVVKCVLTTQLLRNYFFRWFCTRPQPPCSAWVQKSRLRRLPRFFDPFLSILGTSRKAEPSMPITPIGGAARKGVTGENHVNGLPLPGRKSGRKRTKKRDLC